MNTLFGQNLPSIEMGFYTTRRETAGLIETKLQKLMAIDIQEDIITWLQVGFHC